MIKTFHYQILLGAMHEKKIKSHNNKFKLSGPTCNGKFELSYGSFSVADIQDSFQYIIKNINTS